MNSVFLWFVKITGWPIQLFFFKKRVIYENKNTSKFKIKGGALLVSNHTSVYDYPLIMYTFLNRNIHILTAEVIYEKNFWLSLLMKQIGGIKVDRKSYDFSWMSNLIKILKKGKVGLVFPESRIPNENEKGDLLDFKPSYVYVALESGVPIIPLFTNGIYGKQKKKLHENAKIVVGQPIYLSDLYDDKKTEKENIEFINKFVRNKINGLKELVKGSNSYE